MAPNPKKGGAGVKIMRSYDVIVVGAGDVGLGIAFKAASKDLKVALVDKGQVGGTCVNYGCVPSKTLIHRPTESGRSERRKNSVSVRK